MDELPEDMKDMYARWVPTPASVRHARALLDAEPLADMAAIPMVQPGKLYGAWSLDQQVETVPGVVFFGVNDVTDRTGATVPSTLWACASATAVAASALAGRPGTVAYAMIRRDGPPSVWEDVAPGQEL